MKVSLDRLKFAQVFQVAAAVAPRRSPKEILQNVYMRCGLGTVTLMATDMEIGIHLKMDGGFEIEQEGSTLLSTARMSAICTESTAEIIELTTDESGLRVKADKSKFVLQTASPDEFPKVKAFDSESYCTVRANDFKKLIKRTVFAIDEANSRYALGGIRIETAGSEIIAVGTDGRRLATDVSPMVETGKNEQTGAIIPGKAATLMDRAIGGNEDSVDLSLGLNEVMVRSDRFELYCRLVEGRYPAWRQVIPADVQDYREFTLPVGVLNTSLRQAAIVTDNESRAIKFSLSSGMLRLSAATAEIGDSEVEVPIELELDNPVAINLDNRYVSDFCKQFPADEEISFRFKDSGSPVLLDSSEAYRYVIMPMAKN